MRRGKWCVWGMCLALLAAGVSGCGSSGSGETKAVIAADQKEEEKSGEAGGEADQVETETEAAETTEAAAEQVTVEQQVLVDQDGIVITAQEYVTDSIWGDGVKVLLENNSDKDVTVGCNALIVNDYMISDLFVAEVAAGKKANDTIHLSSSELKAAGIDTVGKIEIYFHVYDSASYDTIFDPDCVTIETSGIANMDTTPNDVGTELYNQDGIRIVGKSVDENSFWGTAILLYCENNTGKNVGISVEDMSINGFMMSPFFSTTIYNGKKAIDDITLMSSDLEKNGIETVDEVELKFHIYDADSYSTITDTEPITFSAK